MYSVNQNTNNAILRLLLIVLAFEWLVFVFSGVSFSSLHNASFFSIGVDPLYWLFYGAGLPQFILSQQWLSIACDTLIFTLLAFLIWKPANNLVALILLLMLLLYYVTLTGFHTHRNFQVGFVFVLLPLVFKGVKSRSLAYEGLRYFLLFFYSSSALLKLFSPSIFDSSFFSQVLTQQYVPYFLEHSIGWRTNLNLYLSNNTGIAQAIFFAGVIVELVTVVGFFTKKFDKLLGVLLIGFHFFNWVLMDIAPFGHIAFVCLLFVGKAFQQNRSTSSFDK